MTYRVSYIDTAPEAEAPVDLAGRPRDEYFPTEPAALARARELLDDIHCHTVVVSSGAGEPLRGVCLHLKAGAIAE